MGRTYCIAYRFYRWDTVRRIKVRADNLDDAYEKAVYEKITKTYNDFPYSAWVESVKYDNGRIHEFNTSEACAY